MKQTNTRLLKYAGSKYDFISLINPEINRSNSSIYIEPFCGSASIFFNLEKDFETYLLNDKDRNVIQIFKSFKTGTYSLLNDIFNFIEKKYGDIKNNKESYYNFRNDFNSKLQKTETIEEGFCLQILYNSCLNSLARFGPNGFNQSFGHRGIKLNTFTEDNFNTVNAKLQNCKLYNLDFISLMQKIESNYEIDNDVLMFLDPPYIKRPAGYKTITDNYYITYIEYLKKSKANILYTDIDHEDLDQNKIILRKNMQSISPNRKEELTGNQEVMFINY